MNKYRAIVHCLIVHCSFGGSYATLLQFRGRRIVRRGVWRGDGPVVGPDVGPRTAIPEPGARRCFHVTPYRPDWATGVAKTAEEACVAADTKYFIGHRATDPRVIRSIWDEICKATHVLTDLTGFNPNTALELGIALALGKPTLIIGQDDTVDRLFPTLKKVRCARYTPSDRAGLRKLIIEKLLSL